MTFQITSVTQQDDTITTTVVYTLDDGTELAPIEVPHFRPADADAVLQGVVNRGLTEQVRANATATTADVLPDVEALVGNIAQFNPDDQMTKTTVASMQAERPVR